MICFFNIYTNINYLNHSHSISLSSVKMISVIDTSFQNTFSDIRELIHPRFTLSDVTFWIARANHQARFDFRNESFMSFCDDIMNKLCFNSSFSEIASDYKSLVCFVDRCLFFCPLSFCHCVVYSSSIYEF